MYTSRKRQNPSLLTVLTVAEFRHLLSFIRHRTLNENPALREHIWINALSRPLNARLKYSSVSPCEYFHFLKLQNMNTKK